MDAYPDPTETGQVLDSNRNDSTWTVERSKSADKVEPSEALIAAVRKSSAFIDSIAIERPTDDRCAVPYGVRRAGKRSVKDSQDQIISSDPAPRTSSIHLDAVLAEETAKYAKAFRRMDDLIYDHIEHALHIEDVADRRSGLPTIEEPAPSHSEKPASPISPKTTSLYSLRSPPLSGKVTFSRLPSDESISPLALSSDAPILRIQPTVSVGLTQIPPNPVDIEERLLSRDLDATQALQAFSFKRYDLQHRSPLRLAHTVSVPVASKAIDGPIEAAVARKLGVNTRLTDDAPMGQPERADLPTSPTPTAFSHGSTLNSSSSSSLSYEMRFPAADILQYVGETPSVADLARFDSRVPTFDLAPAKSEQEILLEAHDTPKDKSRFKDKFRRHKNPFTREPGLQVPHHTEREGTAEYRSARSIKGYRRFGPFRAQMQDSGGDDQSVDSSSTRASRHQRWATGMHSTPTRPGTSSFLSTPTPDVSRMKIRQRSPSPFPYDSAPLTRPPIRKSSFKSPRSTQSPVSTARKVSFSIPPTHRTWSMSTKSVYKPLKSRCRTKSRSKCLSDPPAFIIDQLPQFPFHPTHEEREWMQREWTDRLLEDADTGQQSRWKWWRGLKTKMKENMGAGMVIGVVGANLLFLGGGLGLLVSNGRDIGSGDGEWVWALALVPVIFSLTLLVTLIDCRRKHRAAPRPTIPPPERTPLLRPHSSRASIDPNWKFESGLPSEEGSRRVSQSKRSGRYRERGDLEAMFVQEETWTSREEEGDMVKGWWAEIA